MKPSDLVDHLIEQGALHSPELIAAFRTVDRKDFVPTANKNEAYEDRVLPIGHNQTISQPFTVAIMLELLAPQAGERVLDVGAGSGWTTALLAHVVGTNGAVYGTERVPELVTFGHTNLARYGFPHASITSTPDTLGLPTEAPFDKILVSAAAEEVPEVLVEQLRPDGTLVVPVHDAICRVTKTETGATETERFPGFRFVPLVHA